MPNTAAPYGFRPVAQVGGGPFSGATREFPMTVNHATAIYRGDLVNIASGAPIPSTATPTTTLSTSTPVGVMAGCTFTHPGTKTMTWSPYLPAGAITAGYTDVKLLVYDDPNALFQIQSSGACTRAAVGKNAQIANFGGSATTGNSTVHLLHSSIATTSTFAIRIVDVIDPAASYPDVIVKFVRGVHAYDMADGQ
jgi:hypothetical protein